MLGIRTPFRISFAGGSSDMPYYYKKYGGKVISSSINKYMYHFINQYKNKDQTLIKYSRTELIRDNNEIKHPIVKEISKLYNIKGLDIHSIADIPKGSGLGSSSAYTVGLLHGLKYLDNQKIIKNQLAEEACYVEINKLKEPIGKQDQYAVSNGGLNIIEFKKNDTVEVKKISVSKESLKTLNNSIALVKIGDYRNASSILEKQKSNFEDGDNISYINEIQNLVNPMIKAITNTDIKEVGNLLTYNWELKKKLSKNITNKNLEKKFVEILKIKNIYGGKLLGAGKSGYILFEGSRDSISKVNKLNETVKIFLEDEGSKIIIK